MSRMNKSANANVLPALSSGTSVYVTILVVTGAAIISTNSLVIFIYMRLAQKRKTSTNFFLFHQALIDLFNGALLNSLAIGVFLSAGYIGNATLVFYLEFVESLFYHYSIGLSLGSLAVISAERYYSIANPLLHRKRLNKHRVKNIFLFIWCISLVSIPGEFLHCIGETVLSYQIYTVLVFVAFLCAILVVAAIFVAYFHTATAAMQKCIRNNSLNNASVLSTNTTTSSVRGTAEEERCAMMKRKEKGKRLLKIFFGMTVTFVISFIPMEVEILLWVCGGLTRHSSLLEMICHLCFLANSLFNPVLTLYVKMDFRTCLVRLWKGDGLSYSHVEGTSASDFSLHRSIRRGTMELRLVSWSPVVKQKETRSRSLHPNDAIQNLV